MEFFSYSNKNNNYTRAVSLKNLRAVEVYNGDGKSAIRFGVRLTYCDSTTATFCWLECDEAKAVYNQIIDLLNK